jgi:hypothetical protein
MSARGFALLVVATVVVTPLVTSGGEYLGLVRELWGWIGGSALLSFFGVHFVLRRLAELGLRRPGAALRASALAQMEERLW